MAVLAAAVWRARPGGSNTNGGGYDSTNYPGGTDYSQQDAAQATGTVGTAAGTAVFTDAGGLFTAAMVGNVLWIASGAGFTVGPYFIVSRQSTTQVTLDKSPGTGATAHWAVGGGWADFWTNTTAALNYIVPGNTVFILGSGVPNPAAYAPDYTAPTAWTPVVGDNSNGWIFFSNDPATPSYKAFPDTTGGMPLVKVTVAGANWATVDRQQFVGLWIFASGMTAATALFSWSNSGGAHDGCVLDQNGIDIYLVYTGGIRMYGCELTSFSGGSGGSVYALLIYDGSSLVDACNIHDCVGNGVTNTGRMAIQESFVVKCHGVGITPNDTTMCTVKNCVIDGNTVDGININATTKLPGCAIFNNIISNHTGGGRFGINVTAGTVAVNDTVKTFIDYNVYYNNTADVNGISYGTHDTHGGSNPYVGQPTENYTLS